MPALGMRSTMGVSIWAVLGICLLLIGLPIVLLIPPGVGGYVFAYAVGAGAAFLAVAAAQWIWNRWGETQDDDLEELAASDGPD